MEIDLSIVRIDTPHTADYVVDRPNGFYEYLFMCFSTPYFSSNVNGIEIGNPGDCILHDLSFPQYHGTPAGKLEGFKNSWMHLAGDDVKTLAERYSIPFNTIISSSNAFWLLDYFLSLESEFSSNKLYRTEKIKLLLEELFIQVGRQKQLTKELETYTAVEKELLGKFSEIRMLIHEQYFKPWTVKQMANLVNLSPERFWVLYQKYYNTSPKADLISKRIEEAKVMLINSNQSIEQITHHCGFSSINYFFRQFKKRIGYSPSDFRKKTH